MIKRALCSLLILFLSFSTLYAQESDLSGKRIGTTFSKRQCDYLGIDWRKTYLRVVNGDFKLIRLGAYWDEIEEHTGKYDFSILDWEIAEAKKKNVSVILSVGMKAPRWPEFFIPQRVLKKTKLWFGGDAGQDQYLRKEVLRFIRTVVRHYRNEPTIQYWQVENEPLDRSGARSWWINKDFLKEEAETVRKLDSLHRPIIINIATFPNGFLRQVRNLFASNHPIKESLAICDILGLNIYPVVGHRSWRFNFYFWTHPKERQKYFSKILKKARKAGKEVWITELQAEPWEPGILVHKTEERPPTGWPQMTEINFRELYDLGFRTFLLWGAEYWAYRELKFNDPMWLEVVSRLQTREPPTTVPHDNHNINFSN